AHLVLRNKLRNNSVVLVKEVDYGCERHGGPPNPAEGLPVGARRRPDHSLVTGQSPRPDPGGDPSSPGCAGERGSHRGPRTRRQTGGQRTAGQALCGHEAGHDSVSHSYDELAVNILRFMEDRHGKSAVEDFTEDLVARLRGRLGPELDKRGGTTVASRSRALATALTREGYAASATPVAAGTPLEAMQLCQGHCPIQAVAAEFPEICEAELAMFSDY